MAKLYDLMYPGGEYTDKEGQEKTRWIKCGAIIETKNGKKKVKLESIPVEFNGWLECFKDDQNKFANKGAPTRQQAPQDEFEDEIPFS